MSLRELDSFINTETPRQMDQSEEWSPVGKLGCYPWSFPGGGSQAGYGYGHGHPLAVAHKA